MMTHCFLFFHCSHTDRFRQIEVLQQVTTAFSLLVGSGSSHLKVPPRKDMSPDAQEKRRRMGLLFRQASKRSLSQIHRNKSLAVAVPAAGLVTSKSQQLAPSLTDTQLKRVQPGPLEPVSLNTLNKEQEVDSDLQSYPHFVPLVAPEGDLSHVTLKDTQPRAASHFTQKKENPGQTRELSQTYEVNGVNLISN